MFDEKGRFVIENYGKQTTFSSFLPGIGGLYGIPIWCFYVNRGQAVTSFGIQDKDHSIMEFFPAHQAYQTVGSQGFRTFLKVDGQFYEAFSVDAEHTRMYIGMNELEIEEQNRELGLQINVLYYILPEEALGGLVRVVTIKNILPEQRELELLDGMPSVIPYGIGLNDLKEMAQTMKAWMQVEDIDTRMPYYRVRFSTKDSAAVSKIEGGNFFVSLSEKGERLPVIGDPELVFGYDYSYKKPEGFLENSIDVLLEEKQMTQNQVPSGFACVHQMLEGNGQKQIYTVIGQAERKELVRSFAEKLSDADFFREKYKRAQMLTEELTCGIRTKSASPVFDAYCRQTYLDNILRGGFPVKMGSNKIFYVYSRKHGDIERDYNFFSILAQYYSQGNGNFRDVNQNRRCDVLFSPFVKEHNIKMFYNLIQIDGYNPLSVKQVTYCLNKPEEILPMVKPDGMEKVKDFFEKEFSPGSLLLFLEKEHIRLRCKTRDFLEQAIESSTESLNAEFGEGYWTDHWTYHLDLVETFLSVYPEREEALLFDDRTYTYFEAEAVVRPRCERYVKTEQGVRQYHSVDQDLKKDIKHREMRISYGKGNIYTSCLMTKLLVLAANKTASLDMQGMGVEMEAGKPGWYDALNGLPGILGSSMAETYELKRLLLFMKEEIRKYKRQVSVPIELSEFLAGIRRVLKIYFEEKQTHLWAWNHLNICKETYRKQTVWGINGEEKNLTHKELLCIIDVCLSYIEEGISKAYRGSAGVPPTYFAYALEDFRMQGDEIIPVNPDVIELPLFLEGPVRYFKLVKDKKKREELYRKVKASELYDKKLQMYKVNASLQEAPYEIGRARAFSPGWLENESIWLHMEYKYLLELLKAELYEPFFDTLRQIGIPFLTYEQYGRSPLENSSFLVSSVNENEKLHGKGFVARLSGSTAEFLQIWQIMMFGRRLFFVREGKLCCMLDPAIPEYLVPEDGVLECTLLGHTKAVYHVGGKKAVIPGRDHIKKMKLRYTDGGKEEISGNMLAGLAAEKLREGQVSEVQAFFA